MARNTINLEEKQNWLREKHSCPAFAVPPSELFAERHYTVSQIAVMWNLSQDAVRRIFQTEPGVLVLGGQKSRGRRRYTTLRIPASVLERVHRRMVNVGRGS